MANFAIPFDSPLRPRNSLFVRTVSLLIHLGNCPRSASSTEVSCSESSLHRPKSVEFPVKFPVCRESTRRQVRSVLRRQPGIAAFGETMLPARHRPGNGGFSRIRLCLRTPNSLVSGPNLPKVSSRVRGNSRFAETIGGDQFDHDCRPSFPSKIAQHHPSHAARLSLPPLWRAKTGSRFGDR